MCSSIRLRCIYSILTGGRGGRRRAGYRTFESNFALSDRRRTGTELNRPFGTRVRASMTISLAISAFGRRVGPPATLAPHSFRIVFGAGTHTHDKINSFLHSALRSRADVESEALRVRRRAGQTFEFIIKSLVICHLISFCFLRFVPCLLLRRLPPLFTLVSTVIELVIRRARRERSARENSYVRTD